MNERGLSYMFMGGQRFDVRVRASAEPEERSLESG